MTKKAVIKHLKQLKWDIPDTDSRLQLYIDDCIDHPNMHNIWELLAVSRFNALLDKYYLDTKELRRFIRFYEKLSFTGASGRVNYKLTPVQVFQFCSILALKRPDGRRLVREALLFLPRKFGKSCQIAALSVYFLLFGDNDGQIYCAANAFRQAGILYDMVKDLLQGIDPSLQSFKLNRDQAWNLLQGKKSYIRCLASTADKLDALNTSLAIIDEYSNADSSAVKDVLESSMGTRREPLTVVITTNSTKRNTPFQEMLESYKRILRGEIENDELFGHLFTMDEGDREDDPQVWKKVNPHIGVTVQPDYYASSYNKALLTSSGIVEFRTKQLNMLSDKEDAEQWISFSAIKSVIKKVEINPENPFCHIGIDLSSNNDLSAVAFLFYYNKKYYAVVEYFVTESHISTHPKKELYKKWAEKGHINICPGELIDYNMIFDKIVEYADKYEIGFIGYDPYKARELISMINAGGGSSSTKAIRQTFGVFTPMTMAMKRLICTNNIVIDDNPVNQYCFENAILVRDGYDNCKIMKRAHNDKIDGAIALLMALKFYMDE